MADNVSLPASGVSALTDDCGAGHAQRVKIDAGGVDGSFTDASASNPFPVKAGVTVRASANFTRPADTTAYAAGDLVANSTTAGSVAPMSFAGIVRQAGGGGLVRRAKLRKSTTTLTNASFRIHLFSATQTSAGGDNAALNLPGVADYLGSFDVTMDRAFNDGALGIGLPTVGDSIALDIPSTGTTIYAFLEARAAYTPGNAEVFTLELEVLQD